jgi:hypothetical protein
MNVKSWDMNFHSNMMCELAYKGDHLGAIAATGKLYVMDIDFIPFTKLPLPVTRIPKFAALTQVPLSLDLWHVGHNAVLYLDKVVKGITLNSHTPLSTCESCIMAKHPHLPFHPSETE